MFLEFSSIYSTCLIIQDSMNFQLGKLTSYCGSQIPFSGKPMDFRGEAF